MGWGVACGADKNGLASQANRVKGYVKDGTPWGSRGLYGNTENESRSVRKNAVFALCFPSVQPVRSIDVLGVVFS
jgi:hypothetical protein